MPVSDNLYELFARCFPKDRKTVLMETLTGDRFTYADVESMSALYAGMLLELGLQPGDRVAVQVEKSPEAIILYLATLRAGAGCIHIG